MPRNSRSPEAAAYRRLYKSKAWAHYDARGQLIGGVSFQALLRDNFKCRMCGRLVGYGKRTHVADHIQQHKGDRALFFDIANVQTLCPPCHSGPKQSAERKGYSTPAIGVDGWPIQS